MRILTSWMLISVLGGASAWAADFPNMKPQALQEETNDAILEAEMGVSEASVKIEEPKTSTADLKESEIPVFSQERKAEAPTEGSWGRLLISLGIVAIAGLAFTFFGRWWSKRHKTNELNTQIRVLTQHHLGPKKTLAIVRVAGEHILLGVTDHNISMLKTLALIDDEDPDISAGKFTDVLNRRELESAGEGEDFSLKSVRDVVSDRLSKMRSLD